MPDFLLELFGEEIPARMQKNAAQQLQKSVTDALVDSHVTYEGARSFVTPRRLVLSVAGLPQKSKDTVIERKGPRVGVPEKALQGFLRAAGLNNVDEATIEKDPKKGDFYMARLHEPGQKIDVLLADLITTQITKFSWLKSMRWGTGTMAWVRPLRAIVATLCAEGEQTVTLDIEVDGLKAGTQTFGHRFMNPDAITVTHLDDYTAKMRLAHVMLDAQERADTIWQEAQNLCFAQSLTPIEDQGLLEEVAGLVEWPVVMLGTFDEAFLSLPEEVVITSIKAHQKCFCVRKVDTGKLTNKFIIISNLIAQDGGKMIIKGNERVVKARLSDAKFFYDTDLGTPLQDRLEKLKSSIFHQKLGSQFERVARLEKLALSFAKALGANDVQTARAARLCKADLMTEMVYEFPELQGLAGSYYALAQGEDEPVAAALKDHYAPLGPSDDVPKDLVTLAVGLADKIDLLTGFWAIDEKPSSSKDPFALRRAALGVIRIIETNKLRLDLNDWIKDADLIAFFEDRLKVMLKDRGIAHDVVDAVLAMKGTTDLGLKIARIKALNSFVSSQDGAELLAAYKRAANILKVEEKKQGLSFTAPSLQALEKKEEKQLFEVLKRTAPCVQQAVEKEAFLDAMQALAALRAPLDVFFDAVVVNVDDETLKKARFGLLAQVRDLMHQVALFSALD